MSKKRLTREESKRETRNKLLHVATKTFLEKGFYGASIDEIAEEAGFSKGAVYSNFGSKEDLFIAVFSERLQKDIQSIKTIYQQQTSLLKYMEVLEESYHKELKENKAWGALMLEFLIYALREESARKKLAPILQKSRKQSEEILKHFENKEESNFPLSPEKLSFLILALDVGTSILHFVSEEDVPKHIVVDGLKQLLKLDSETN
ncbi:TetR/AcrR family transcriptional regulator [Pseudogracilibacillus auburnensis]|uniref:TetR/AcrR family transcriptional regulator n=1 Tax=Pseudogracilibacillus auburnensis TaxID=1494959 RepID=UPI001A964DE3|nr:TetR/AcrR family transcriptional regulator [Pseudogracilibacillus auburnensis]MBO1004634.1 TetR/AcrR family transcriptional regulator [Pseudogracilibacillus auburnensis]